MWMRYCSYCRCVCVCGMDGGGDGSGWDGLGWVGMLDR